jgi:lipid-A-disaccharide synthase
MRRILIVTGEASGDLHGANLAIALRGLAPDLEVLGVGGPNMAAAGVRLLPDIRRVDVIGLPGVAGILAAWHNIRTIVRFLRRTPLDAVVFIDHPGTNLRLARHAKRAGHRVVYYISPQIWAWAPWRIRLIKRVVDRMLVILPFEEELYRKAGVACLFVGHPLLDAVKPSYDRAELRKGFGVDDADPVLGLLPGSRTGEVTTLFPVMLEAVRRLRERFPRLAAIVAQASSIPRGLLERLAAEAGVNVRVVSDQPNEVMVASDFLFVASGTATLQAAIIGTPMVLLYRMPVLNFWLAMALVRGYRGGRVQRLNSVGLVNLVAGRPIVAELRQGEATPERACAEAMRFLGDPARMNAMRDDLRRVRDMLGSPGASRRAAAAVLEACGA